MTAGGDGAELVQLHEFMMSCLTQLRQGQVPEFDTAALPPRSAVVAAEFLRVARHIKTKNLSLMHGLETLHDGLVIFDADQRLIFANESARAFFQQKVRIDTGVHLNVLMDAMERNQIANLSTPKVLDWAARALTGNADPLIVSLGSKKTYRWTGRGDALGNLVVIATDITRETARQTELENLMVEVNRASNAKTTFLAHMSHELRTPMNGVIGMAEMLCDSGLDPERQRYAETIRNSAEALLSIINDVLDYSRGRSDGVRLTESSFDLEAVVVEVATLLQPAARAKGLDLRLFVDPLMPQLWTGDAGRMRQIIVNLIGNAVKYTEKGFVRVIVIPGPDGPHILIYDSGPGIPDLRVDSIFEEFTQLAEPGVTGISGSGLGLAITAQLIEAMGGNLWLSSEMGVGSTFGFTLPLSPLLNQPAPASLPGTGNTALMVVQENRCLSRQLRRMLSGTGVQTRVCGNEEEIADILDSGCRPALVLIVAHDDADRTGRRLDLLRHRLPDIPVWLMSTASQHSPNAHQFDRVLTTPLTRETLVTAVVSQLTQRSETPVAAATPPASADAQPAMTVLVADDNATNRLVIEKMLRNCDITMLTAENGQQALEIWQVERPDLILMDVSMPVMNGREAAMAIRSIESAGALPRTPIVAVTAAVSDQDRAEVLAAGIDDLVSKPVRRAVLIEQLVRYAPATVRPPVPEDPAPTEVGAA